jgi:multisubunit Na+/H+ antiporter MnhG subunit
MELSNGYNIMRSILILLNSFAVVSGIFGLIRAVPQFKRLNNEDNYATYLTIISIILIVLSFIAIYSSYFLNSTLLLAYGLCLLLSLFLIPMFWNTEFLLFSSNSAVIVPILIVVLILISMCFSISLAMKIRNIKSEYEAKADK